jgi:hypothetical protein
MRVQGPEGKIGHAEIQIGDSRMMLADEHAEINFILHLSSFLVDKAANVEA